MFDSTFSTTARSWVRRRILALAVLVVLIDSQAVDSNNPGILVDHLPHSFSYRSGNITANVSGRILFSVSGVRYQVNGGPSHLTVQEGPRVHKPLFCVEIDPHELHPGSNTISITAVSRFRGRSTVSRNFNYDPAPVRLPLEVTWSNLQDLQVDSGIWDTVEVGNDVRLRPKPGFEDYDRIVLAAAPFAGGRRVTTDVIFRRFMNNKQGYGFGVLPLWGGRPDDRAYSPRRGWNFSVAWYYSRYQAVGEEFSWKDGDEEPGWVSSYRNFDLEPGVKYQIVTEAWEVLDKSGQHKHYHQRTQWRTDSTADTPWIELSDGQGVQIPPGEYAVGLIAHRCQVEFGPVRVEPLAPQVEATSD